MFDKQISDVEWAPHGYDFIVISGSQPSTMTLYDREGKAKFEFGKQYRNTVRYSPLGHIVLMGGFGNLAGEMEFWDKDKMKQVSTCKAYCSVKNEWAPDGIHFSSAVLFPRVRVDNEITVFNYLGEKVATKSFSQSELYGFEFRPLPIENFKQQ